MKQKKSYRNRLWYEQHPICKHCGKFFSKANSRHAEFCSDRCLQRYANNELERENTEHKHKQTTVFACIITSLITTFVIALAWYICRILS